MRNRKPPFVDQGHTLSIDGTCVSENGKYHVHGLLPGEQALIQPLKKRRGTWVCLSSEHQDLHTARVVPPCEHANICGGCAFQHFARSAQLSFKEEWLKALFSDQKPIRWLETISGDDTGYRSKARLGVKFVEKKQRTLIGFREVGSAKVADLDACKILVPELDRLLGPLRDLIDQLEAKTSIPQIEVAAARGQVALVVRHLVPLSEEDLLRLKMFEAIHRIMLFLQSKGPSTVAPLSPTVSPLLSYELLEQKLSYEFHPMDFTQVNQAVNQLMVNRALELLDLNTGDAVLDAFCGIGNFSLPIAQLTKQVWGLESAPESVARATSNAARNGLSNVEFFVADLYSASFDKRQLPEANKMLLDPPRSGAEYICQQILDKDIETIVYVSCNPRSLRRDTDILVKGGYELDALGMIDMFPHTAQMESIAKFTRPKKNG